MSRLDRPMPWLGWANEAVYPWYVLHQSLILVLAWWLMPLHLGPVLEPLAVIAGTVLGCAMLSAAIARVPWLRPCFGMKRRPRPATMPAEGVPA